MISGKKYINSIKKYIDSVNEGEGFRVGVLIEEQDMLKLKELGFSQPIQLGETVVPPIKGRFTRYNLEGKEILQKDKEKETVYRQQYHTRVEFHGRNNKVEVTDFVDIPMKRFPRLQITGPSLELTIEKKEESTYLMINNSFIKSVEKDEIKALTAINIFLEIFNRAEILSVDLDAFIKPKELKRLNWILFPQGERLNWEEKKERYNEMTKNKSNSKKMVIWDRLQTIDQYSPDFEAIGINGFSGYVIFGFESLGVYVFESAYKGNATYIIKGDWEMISKMTKAEIVRNSLHEHRLIHREQWKRHIDDLLRKI
ncbi:conserved hypothetical protein [Bacillus sp. 349Y]|nr:conserved hypothetical protein [Bacillus sp. 349Y]